MSLLSLLKLLCLFMTHTDAVAKSCGGLLQEHEHIVQRSSTTASATLLRLDGPATFQSIACTTTRGVAAPTPTSSVTATALALLRLDRAGEGCQGKGVIQSCPPLLLFLAGVVPAASAAATFVQRVGIRRDQLPQYRHRSAGPRGLVEGQHAVRVPGRRRPRKSSSARCRCDADRGRGRGSMGRRTLRCRGAVARRAPPLRRAGGGRPQQ
mmetsp:Transcript_40667/g.122442  ORF Transcript_40667/g.122442 Transcript_40667/m.122442 type:complete len:210 (-) Transcript_40667:385-1014(-)